jgi:hypothetical protein
MEYNEQEIAILKGMHADGYTKEESVAEVQKYREDLSGEGTTEVPSITPTEKVEQSKLTYETPSNIQKEIKKEGEDNSDNL